LTKAKYLAFLIRHLAEARRSLGTANAISYLAQRVAPGIGLRGRTFTLRTPDARHPIRLRRGTSDIQSFRQVFGSSKVSWLNSTRTRGSATHKGRAFGQSTVRGYEISISGDWPYACPRANLV
jgi:hypothetical protein